MPLASHSATTAMPISARPRPPVKRERGPPPPPPPPRIERMKAWMRAMIWSTSGIGRGPPGRPPNGPPGPPPPPQGPPPPGGGRWPPPLLPPEPPPGVPQGLGPPLLDDMLTVPVRSSATTKALADGAPCAISPAGGITAGCLSTCDRRFASNGERHSRRAHDGEPARGAALDRGSRVRQGHRGGRTCGGGRATRRPGAGVLADGPGTRRGDGTGAAC